MENTSLKIANRLNTNSYKWNVKENELPMFVADMDFETAPCVKNAILKKAEIGAYGYSDIPDEYFASFSRWYKKYHGYKIKKKWMVYSTGVVAAISSAVRKFTTPNEKVLIQAPVYNIFYNSILNNGRQVISSDLVYENNAYHIDFDDLERKMSDPQVSMMVLCNPHNPVGKIWSKDELVKIGKLAYKHHVLVISDEIHCELTKPGLEYIPYASASKLNEENSITCISTGKTFNLAGMQSACIFSANEMLRHKIWRQLNTDECGEPNFFAIEANIAALNKGHEWMEELKKYLWNNREYCKTFIRENLPEAILTEAEATYLLWLDVTYLKASSNDLCEYIRKTTGLILSSGSSYGACGDGFLRINVATSLENVKDGMARLKTALDSYKNK